MSVGRSGELLWQHCLGSEEQESPKKILKAPDGSGFYLIASTNASEPNGNVTQASNGQDDIWIMKMDFKGNLIWEAYYGGSELDQYEYAMWDENNQLKIILNTFSTDHYFTDRPDSLNGCIMTLSENGTFISNQYFMTQDSLERDEIMRATFNPSGDIMIHGTTQFNWQKPFNRDSINSTTNDAFKPLINIINEKQNAQNRFHLEESWSNGWMDQVNKIKFLSDSICLLIGRFNVGFETEVAVDTNAAFVLQYNINSKKVLQKVFPDVYTGGQIYDIIEVKEDSSLLLFGKSESRHNPYSNNFYCVGCEAGSYPYPPDFWLLKLGSKSPRNEILKNFGRVYPNPTLGANNLTVVAEAGKNISQIRLITTLGQVLKRQVFLNEETTETNISLTNHSDGVYFIQVRYTDGTIQNHNLVHQQLN